MSHWKEKFPSKYLRSDDVGDELGDFIDCTVRRVVSEKVGRNSDDGEKWVLEFKEQMKGLPLNATNCKMLEKLTDSGAPTRWIGLAIQLYLVPTTTPSGEETLGIRIRARKAPKKAMVVKTTPVVDAPSTSAPDDDTEAGDVPF